MDDQNQDHKTGGLLRWFPRNRNVKNTSFFLPVVAVLALAIAGSISLVALRSGVAEGIDVTGEWHIGLTVHRGPVQELVGQSVYCTASLSETNNVLQGAMDCDLVGASQEMTGFVFPYGNDIRISTSFSQVTIEILAQTVSSIQMIGSWNDSQGFEGRFVATKVELARP